MITAVRLALVSIVAAEVCAAQNRLQAITVAERDSVAEVSLVLDRAPVYRAGVLHQPERVYIDLDGVSRGTRFAIPELPADGAVERIRLGVQPGGVLRVVFDLRESVDYAVTTTGQRMVVTLSGMSKPAPRVLTLLDATPPSDPQPPTIENLAPTAPIAVPLSTTFPEPTVVLTPAEPPPVPTFLDASPVVVIPDKNPSVEPGKTLRVARLAKPLTLADFRGGREPIGLTPVTEFLQRRPGDGLPASLGTKAYVAYDAKNLYVAFVCDDDPAKIRGRLSKREDIGEDDAVTVYLDTFHDGQRAFYFTLNPLGIQADGVLTGMRNEDSRFDTLWNSDGAITPSGYSVLFTIPFKSLRFSSQEQQTWGIALKRYIVRNNEEIFWPYVTQRTTSVIQQMANLVGMEDISPSRNVQLIPYAASTSAQLLDTATGKLQSQSDPRAGMDAKVVFRDSITVDLTANPDFSQVESNDPQVTVNQRYEVYFPEKRPFFLESISYFDTPLQMLFTRRIADPQFGARLSGKAGRWNVGLLEIDDRAP